MGEGPSRCMALAVKSLALALEAKSLALALEAKSLALALEVKALALALALTPLALALEFVALTPSLMIFKLLIIRNLIQCPVRLSESLWSKICTDKHDYFILRVCYRRDENIYFSVLRLQQMGIIPYYFYIYIDGRL